MSEQHESTNQHEVVVHDEDDGNVFKIKAKHDELVRTVVRHLYENDLHREQRSGDRLRCEANGEDVFSHEDETVHEFRDKSCHDLIWLFCGEQGGAQR